MEIPIRMSGAAWFSGPPPRLEVRAFLYGTDPIFRYSLLGDLNSSDTTILKIPDYFDGPLVLEFRAGFFDIQSGKSAETGAAAFVHRLEAIDVVAPTEKQILVNLTHQYRDEFAVPDQCTVQCLSSGERRTGRNVCIDCQTPYGIFKICC
jgi:hypothetical protein